MEAIRNMYAQMGVDNFYKEHGNEYKNPHTEIINQLLSKVDVGDKILDLCCGSGEVTKNFLNKDIIGCDPYTFNLYQKETGKPVLTFSFKDIATGALADYQFDTIICSFAMHLCEPSMLNLVFVTDQPFKIPAGLLRKLHGDLCQLPLQGRIQIAGGKVFRHHAENAEEGHQQGTQNFCAVKIDDFSKHGIPPCGLFSNFSLSFSQGNHVLFLLRQEKYQKKPT